MPEALRIVGCDRMDGNAVLIELSDGTAFSLSLEQILTLRGNLEPDPAVLEEES